MEYPHLIRKITNPVSAPPEAGIHWINTLTGVEFFSVATNTVADWLIRAPSGGVTDHLFLSNIGTNTHAQIDTFIASKAAANGLASLGASGTIPIAQIPPSAIERLVVVADQTVRYALTTTTAQNGDTIKQTDTGQLYFVIDETNLGNSAGYVAYTAGAASSVPWSGITGIPAPVSSLSGANTGDETTVTIGTLINNATAKATPVDADFLGLMDSAAANVLKKLSWANVKATLKTYFDTLYTGTVTSVSVTTANGVSGSVATATTTPAITLTLGDIAPSKVTCTGELFSKSTLRLTTGPVAVTGNTNIFLGISTGTTASSGTNNIGIGEGALSQVTTGLENIAIGYQSLIGITTAASSNTAVGHTAARSNTSGISNVAIGKNAGYQNSTGDNNTSVGTTCLFNITGSNNTAIGFNAGISTTNKSGCVFVGHKAGYDLNTSNLLTISNAQAAYLLSGNFATGQLGVNIIPTSIQASAILDLTSTTQALLLTRMTYTQMLAIGTPATGMIVSDSVSKGLFEYGTRWAPVGNFNPQYYSHIGDEFISSTSTGSLDWLTTNTGTGSGSAISNAYSTSVYKAQGCVSLTTGTGAAGRSAITLDTPMAFGYSDVEMRSRVLLPNASDGTDTFQAIIGFGDTPANNDVVQANGAFFIYDTSISATFWAVRTVKASVVTTTTTSIAFVADVFSNFEIFSNEAGTSVVFKINGTTAATHTTNIPLLAIGPIYKINKTVGTNPRLLVVDYFWQRQVWSAGR